MTKAFGHIRMPGFDAEFVIEANLEAITQAKQIGVTGEIQSCDCLVVGGDRQGKRHVR